MANHPVWSRPDHSLSLLTLVTNLGFEKRVAETTGPEAKCCDHQQARAKLEYSRVVGDASSPGLPSSHREE